MKSNQLAKDANAYGSDSLGSLEIDSDADFLVGYTFMINIGAEHSLKYGSIENNVIS